MSSPPGYHECFALFTRRDYAGCARSSMALIDSAKTHELLQIFLISLYRSGQHRFADGLVPDILRATAHDSWVQALLRLTTGQTGPAEVLALIKNGRQRCQGHYYVGANLLTNGFDAEALVPLQEAIQTGERCTEADLARLESAVPAIVDSVWESMTSEQFDWFNAQAREAGKAILGGKVSQARELAKQAYERAAGTLNEDSAAMGATLHLIANIYFRLGDYLVARSLAREAKDLFQENLGVRHRAHLDCMERLTAIEIAAGDEDQAAALLREKRALWSLTHVEE